MDQRALINAIVRQTMVLTARLSTVKGVRSPLEHVANEVFMNLVRELESQGVGKKIIADMFGLALRSYQQKVQRLSESATERGVTLWQAVHGFLSTHESATRAEVLERFKQDEEKDVGSILNDLVESGLVLRRGRGASARYRVATKDELSQLGASSAVSSEEKRTALVWVLIYREGPLSKDQLEKLLSTSSQELDDSLSLLLARGQVRSEEHEGVAFFTADHCVIPVGQAAGWEASLIDHHRAMSNALAAKVASGNHASAAQDELGGTTATFDFWPGHPREQEIRRLLSETRAKVFQLFDEVTADNHEKADQVTRHVTFYFGQYAHDEEEP